VCTRPSSALPSATVEAADIRACLVQNVRRAANDVILGAIGQTKARVQRVMKPSAAAAALAPDMQHASSIGAMAFISRGLTSAGLRDVREEENE